MDNYATYPVDTVQVWNVSAKELHDLIAKAINTMEPQQQPEWAMPLCDKLNSDEHLKTSILIA